MIKLENVSKIYQTKTRRVAKISSVATLELLAKTCLPLVSYYE